MTSNELARKLKKLGAEITPPTGGGSHHKVSLNGRESVLAMHGKKELPKGTVLGILKRLGLTLEDL